MKKEVSKKILIVDDDQDFCIMLSKFLSGQGYNPHYALNGESALKRVYEEPWDLIILDIMMPGIDGYEVCHRLKMQKEYNRIPILMLSAKDTEQDKIIGLKTGADAYMFKPFEVDELISNMDEVFERHERTFQCGIQHEITFNFQSQFKYLEEVNELVACLFKNTNLASDEIWELKLALHELGINAIEHGNKMNPSKMVRLKCQFFDDRLEFEMQDEGEGFELAKVPNPTREPVLSRERGRGIFLVNQVVDEIKYENGGSCARLIKYINKK